MSISRQFVCVVQVVCLVVLTTSREIILHRKLCPLLALTRSLAAVKSNQFTPLASGLECLGGERAALHGLTYFGRGSSYPTRDTAGLVRAISHQKVRQTSLLKSRSGRGQPRERAWQPQTSGNLESQRLPNGLQAQHACRYQEESCYAAGAALTEAHGSVFTGGMPFRKLFCFCRLNFLWSYPHPPPLCAKRLEGRTFEWNSMHD